MGGDTLRAAFRCVDFRGLERVDVQDVERAVAMIGQWREEHRRRVAEYEEAERSRAAAAEARVGEELQEREREWARFGPKEAERVRRVVEGAVGNPPPLPCCTCNWTVGSRRSERRPSSSSSSPPLSPFLLFSL